jgi:hypothetical protein
MKGPRDIGREYTGKHRRDDGRGLAGTSPWAGRAESYARPAADARPLPAAAPVPGTRPDPGFWLEPGPRPDAG